MRYTGAIAACSLLYPTLSYCQGVGEGSTPVNDIQDPSGQKPSPSLSVPTVRSTPTPISLLGPSTSASNEQSPDSANIAGPVDLSGPQSFLTILVEGRPYNFSIDVSAAETYLFSYDDLCKDPSKDSSAGRQLDQDTCANLQRLPQPGSKENSNSFRNWSFMSQSITVNMLIKARIGPALGLNGITCSLVTQATDDNSQPISFQEYFNGVHGILGLGTGSPVLKSIVSDSKKAPGYSLYLGNNGVQGNIIFGGYNRKQFSPSPETATVVDDPKMVTLESIESNFLKSGGAKNITALFDPTSPSIIIPDSIYDVQVGGTDPWNITLNFLGGLRISLSSANLSNIDSTSPPILAGPDPRIILGRPFFHAAYFGTEGNGKGFVGLAVSDPDVFPTSFDGVDTKISPSSATSNASPIGPSSTSLVSSGSSSNSRSKKTNVGAIVGGVIGALIFLSLLAFLFICCRRRRRMAGYGGRKRGMSKEFPEEDEMARGINAANSFGSQEAPPDAQASTSYVPVPPPPPRLTAPDEPAVKNEMGVTSYDPSPITPSSMAAIGGVIGGGSAAASAHNTQPNSVANSPQESKRFSAFSGISRKPVPQRASRQIDPDSDDEAEQVSVRSPASEFRATSPPTEDNRNSFQAREVPRLPFNRGPSDSPAF